MNNRRSFLKDAFWGSFGFLFLRKTGCASNTSTSKCNLPVVISTWSTNHRANQAAWEVLKAGSGSLDAVEAGVRIPEADPLDHSVGYGGLPDRDGNVTLDACIMDPKGFTGAVICLENILHPISVARKVMEASPHVILSGKGAEKFALEHGFETKKLLTPYAEQQWKQWLENGDYDPNITPRSIQDRIKENHDTIGMLTMDKMGEMSGACTTSGLAFKLNGRVGDSPIIGAGLFVDNEVGGATATGVGEAVIRICGAHVIVEQMRTGKSPEQACKEAIRRIVKVHGDNAKQMQVGFIAMNMKGEYGGYSLLPGFTYCVQCQDGSSVDHESPSWYNL